MTKRSKTTDKINFMGHRILAMTLSGFLVIGSVVILVVNGLAFGLDFTGGTLVEVGYQKAADLEKTRTALKNAGFKDASVQYFGTSRDILIRIAPAKSSAKKTDIGSDVLEALRKDSLTEVTVRRVEFVGPQIGEELTEQGGLALLYALFGILIYVTLRFEFRFALGSVFALVHDVLIILGFFSFTQLDFDLTVLASLLAVIGYSLNDTIVVFDRIRENFRMMRRAGPVEVVNRSINMTISRTIMTSVTTLLVLIALFYYGGEVIHGFSLALIIGVVIGTYSSIYIASTSALALGINRKDIMPTIKEEKKADFHP